MPEFALSAKVLDTEVLQTVRKHIAVTILSSMQAEKGCGEAQGAAKEDQLRVRVGCPGNSQTEHTQNTDWDYSSLMPADRQTSREMGASQDRMLIDVSKFLVSCLAFGLQAGSSLMTLTTDISFKSGHVLDRFSFACLS